MFLTRRILTCCTEKQALADNKEMPKDPRNVFNNITLGSQQNSTTVQDLLNTHSKCGESLHQFQDKLHKFLVAELGGEVHEDNLVIHLSTKVPIYLPF